MKGNFLIQTTIFQYTQIKKRSSIKYERLSNSGFKDKSLPSKLKVKVILSYFQRSLSSWLIQNIVPDQTPQRTAVPGSRTALGGSWPLLTPATFPTVCRLCRLSWGHHCQRCFLPVHALPSTETRKGTLTLQISKHNKVIMLLCYYDHTCPNIH